MWSCAVSDLCIWAASSRWVSRIHSSSLTGCAHIACITFEGLQERKTHLVESWREKVAGIYLYSPIATCHLPLAKVYPTGNGVHCTELYHMTFDGHSWLWFIFESKSNEGSSSWIELDTWGPKIQLWETQNEGHSQVANISQFQCPCLRNLFMVPVRQKKYLTIHIIAQLGQTVFMS